MTTTLQKPQVLPVSQGATPDRAALRSLLGTSSGILGFWAFHNALLLPWEIDVLSPEVRAPALLAIRALVWLCPIALYLRRHDARPPLVALGITSPIHVRGMLRGATPGLLYLALTAAVQVGGSGAPWPPLEVRLLLNVGTVYMTVLTVFEEVLMRGFLLNQLCRHMRSWTAQAIVAVLFAGMHLPGWIATQGLSIELLPMSISLGLLGIVLGIIALSSRSIVPAIALHWLNNVQAQWLGGG